MKPKSVDDKVRYVAVWMSRSYHPTKKEAAEAAVDGASLLSWAARQHSVVEERLEDHGLYTDWESHRIWTGKEGVTSQEALQWIMKSAATGGKRNA